MDPVGTQSAEARAVLGVLLDAVAEGVVMTDVQGRIVRANEAADAILGRRRDDLLGRNVLDPTWEHAEPVAGQDGGAPLAAPLRDGKSFVGRLCSVERTDGRRVLVSVNGSPLRDEGGRVSGAVYCLEDVTARVKAEDGVRAAGQSLYAFMERSPDAIVIHRHGKVVYVNPALVRYLGYGRAEELIGRAIASLTHPDDRAKVLQRVDRMQRFSEPVPLQEERFLRSDGSDFAADVFALPIFFEGERAILAFGHDLAPQRRAEEDRRRFLDEETRLKEEAQRRAAELRGILANIVSGLFVTDASGRITLTNRAAVRMLGLKAQEELQRDIGEVAAMLGLRRPDGGPLPREELPLARALAGETVVQQDEIFRAPGRRDRYLRSSAAPIRDAHGEVVAAVEVVRDVTDIIEFDQLKDQFIRVVAHELKTPLAVLKGYAELLRRTPPDAPAPRRALEAIGRGADRIDRIVRDMLELSQILVGELRLEREPLDLADLVRRVVLRFSPGLSRHRLHVEATPVEVRADRARMEQVVLRLLDNAARYSPAGGDIQVKVSESNGFAEVSVRDQGVGIPEDKHVRVFERFYRAHTDTPHDYGGLGIGLFLSREIVTKHGGQMWFESAEDVGSTFHFTLPVGDDHGE